MFFVKYVPNLRMFCWEAFGLFVTLPSKNMEISIRKTTTGDLGDVMAIYDYARQKMIDTGNPIQWVDGYPSEAIIADDIESGNSYVIENGERIIGVFTFIVGEDPTYRYIDGHWLNDCPYGTIHRIAAAPGAHGIADFCLAYCKSKKVDIRIDTHADNTPMLNWISSRHFTYCGIIFCHDDTPRKAFHLPFSADC